MNAIKAFKVGRYGPTVDPRGAQVVWDAKPWDVIGCRYESFGAAGFRLELRSFNRELTALAPLHACEVLERDHVDATAL